MKKLYAMLAVCFGAMTTQAYANPVDVAYTVTGSAGDWNLDFSVTNNLGGTNSLYFFGVALSANDITGSPAGWDPSSWSTWNPATYGGSGPDKTYNNNWFNPGLGGISPGATLSGFDVHLTDLADPASASWFAYAYGGNYQGDFNPNSNPGFAGVANSGNTPDPVPEPAALALMSTGLLGLTLARRKKQS